LGWIAALFLSTACGGAPVGVETSGFLGDTSQLEPGRGDQLQLVYIDPEADFSGYQRVLLDPVVVGESTEASEAPTEELQALAVEFDTALRKQLQLEFELVESPGPRTLRIRTALTSVRASGASVEMEMEILDATSGARLVAVADTRGEVGESGGATRDGASARKAFDFWAKRARVRLAAFRSFDAAEAAHDAGAVP
jgi:hypothetical protein